MPVRPCSGCSCGLTRHVDADMSAACLTVYLAANICHIVTLHRRCLHRWCCVCVGVRAIVAMSMPMPTACMTMRMVMVMPVLVVVAVSVAGAWAAESVCVVFTQHETEHDVECYAC